MNTIANILIVEDDIMTLELLSLILKKENYRITIANDGNEAIQIAQKATFDLAIVEMLIPPRSGLEVVSFLYQNFPNLPIVALSYIAEEENTVEEAFELGVSDFIAKPFNPKELTLRLKRLLKKSSKNN